jgi:hypothetical protein
MMRIQTLEREGPKDALQILQTAYAHAGQPLDEARARSQGALRNQLIERATIEAYHDSFRLVSMIGLLLVPMVLMIRSIDPREAKSPRFSRKQGRQPSSEHAAGERDSDRD